MATGPRPRTVELPPGQHSIVLANANSFRFDVDAEGNIPEADSHKSGNKTLTFKTVRIAIDPGDRDQDGYTGNYSVASVDDEDAPGPRTIVLIPGVTKYILRIANANSFRFDVDAKGQIPKADSHKSGNKTLTFKTVRIAIDPDGYTGPYFVKGVDNRNLPERRTFVLMPGVNGYIILPGGSRFDVDAEGVPKPPDLSVTINGVTYKFVLTAINDLSNCAAGFASPDGLWPPNHKFEQVVIDGVLDKDSLDKTVTLQITGVTQDEPVNGLGDGDTSPDAIIQGGSPADTVEIRAERAGAGDGRVYVVSFTASDGSESCTGAVTVGVPPSKHGTAVDSGQDYDSTQR